VIDSKDQQPLYRQLVGSINTRIQRGDWETGAQLPSERELSEQFGVSRSTVRQALDGLARVGMLKKVQGRGTFVTGHGPINQPLAHATVFRETVAAQDMAPALRVIARTQEPADFVLGRLLSVPPNAMLIRLVWLGLGDREPLVLYKSYFSAPKMHEVLVAFCDVAAPSEHYALRAGVRELKAEQTFEARMATAEEADMLDLVAPTAVFNVTSLIYGPDGDRVEYRQAVYRGDRYKFNMERSLHL